MKKNENVAKKQDGTAKSIARWTALGALFLIPLTPLLVADGSVSSFFMGNMFFPFISGKAFFFRILVEFAVGGWVVLAVLDAEYRPRFSWVMVAVLSFVSWMFVADLFAINVAKAFWSNFERMEGWVLLIHLLGLFFAMSSVLRVEKKWRAWFLTSLGVSVIVCIHSLLQLSGTYAIHQGSTRIDASLGNSAYLAIYFLFNVFIALWLALTEKYSWLKWSLIALAVLEAVLIFFTETRGTVIGLTVGFALAAFLTILTAGKHVRRIAAGTFAVLLILVGGFYLARNSSFVQNNHILQRIASISLSDGQVRFTIWHMAFQGVLERPIVGWGQEGFNYVFNKYYDPSLYHQEPWFDRAHNAFIDWLSAGGIPAFLLYLSLFGSALVLLWRSSELSRPERIAVTAALVGYAIHNLFVFDNLYSYVYFFALLALIDSQVGRPFPRLEKVPVLTADEGIAYALPIAAAVVIAAVWFVNIPGMRVGNKLIVALSPAQSLSVNTKVFQELVQHPAFGAQEIREQLINYGVSAVQSTTATNDEKQQAVALAVTEMQKQVAAYPLDTREQLELSFIYRSIGDGQDALKAIEAAKLLSPNKEDILIQAGAIEWDLGDLAAAQKDFVAAYELAPQFSDLAVYAAAGDLVVGNTEAADAILTKAYGTTVVDSDILAVAYYRTKAWPRLIALWKARTELPTANAQTWFGLAASYYAAGQNQNAITIINKVIALYPETAAAGAAALAQIRGGKGLPTGQ